MKKLAIAGASAVLAALPVVGVFAATQSTVTDTVKLTVTQTCQMEADAAAATYDLGSSTVAHAYSEVNGSLMTITCNSLKGWTLKATANALANTTTGYTSVTIPFGAYGTTSSVWSAKVTASGGTVASGWDDYTAATASDTTIVSGSSVSGITVQPAYKAYAAATQQTGTYQGTIVYTFAENAS